MCGFSGWILNTEKNTESIVSSLRTIKHRGPDDTRIFSGAPNPDFYSCDLSNTNTSAKYELISCRLSSTCFGFNRLAIVDLSSNGMQPFYDDESKLLFMMNGEIYNYLELKSTYLSDIRFKSDSDSEVAFELYKKNGDSFVDKLSGMFAIVIYDYKTNILKVWRDRLGIKPFYYSLTDSGFFFSSEMKGLFAMGIEKSVDYQGLAYSMYLGTCPSPLTIYSKINSLQPGHFLEFNKNIGKVEIKNYWRLEYNADDNAFENEIFKKDVSDLCALYATGEVEKAIMLSGGLDSGTLACFYGKYNDSMQAIHIFNKTLDSEFEFAQLNAKNAGINIHNFEIEQSLSAEQIDFFLRSEEEPNTGPEPAVFLCDKIKDKGVKVLYNALGPDEIFGGYAYYQKIAKIARYSVLLKLPKFMLPVNYRNRLTEIQMFGMEVYPFIARQLFTWSEIKAYLMSKNQTVPEHPILYIKKQVANIYPDFVNMPLLKKISYYDIFYYIASHHTFRSDQPSMLYSIEMRFPFLEHTFVQKYFNQADTFKKIEKQLKPDFRNFAKEFLSPEILMMKKQGFTIPVQNLISSKNMKDAQKQWYLLMFKQIFNS